MSLTETRDEIVEAIASAGLPDKVLRAWPRYRQTVRAGDAWPRLAGRNRPANGFGYVDTWEVWLVLPQGLSDAEKWLDDHLETLLDGLNNSRVFAGGVTSVTPAELQLGGTNAVNGVILTGAREG